MKDYSFNQNSKQNHRHVEEITPRHFSSFYKCRLLKLQAIQRGELV